MTNGVRGRRNFPESSMFQNIRTTYPINNVVNFQPSQMFANRYGNRNLGSDLNQKQAERFGSNSETFRNLGYSQMIQLLKLPAGEEEKFIAEKAKVEFNSFSQQAGKYQG